MDAPVTTLRADLLGEVRFAWAGTPVAPRSRKGTALLLVLALEGAPVERAALAELLWAPDRVQSVRQALHALRSLPGAAHWLDAGPTVALRVDSDVARFHQAVDARAYATALDVWTAGRGDPSWRDDLWREAERGVTSAFTDWLDVERERLRGAYLACLTGRAAELERSGEVTDAARLVDALLACDPLNETEYRGAMRLAVARGDPHEALALFERCRQVLDTELGVAPLEETQSLAREVEATLPQILRAPRRRLPLPAHVTPFVGRADELAALAALLRSEASRLVTLVGAGGVGKTSLAIEAAVRSAASFPDGATFVPLAGVARPDDVPSSIAQALDLPLADGASVDGVVVDALRDASALLLVDNVEHVVDAARRVDPGFTLSSATAAHVGRLVRGVEGVPLAIVLAATWVRHIPLPELAEAVVTTAHDLDVETDVLPSRHRSLRAAFGHSWQLLGDDERRHLASLAVCRGGFERDAGEAIAGCSLRALLALVNKSLLTRDALGRFGMLETIRASALAALSVRQAQAVHARHYLRWLGSLRGELEGPRQLEAQRSVMRELDNVRAALSYAVAAADVERIDESLAAYDAFVHLRGLFAEGARTYAAAIAALEPLGACLSTASPSCTSVRVVTTTPTRRTARRSRPLAPPTIQG